MNIIKKTKNRKAIYLCDCGREFEAFIYNVKSGNTKSCGCYFKKRLHETFYKHGGSGTRLFKIYNNIRHRCLDNTDLSYNKYGGRGIMICEKWRNSFIEFRNWSLENGYMPNLEIDRINNNLGYDPSNCRWTTRIINAQNQRRIRVNNKSGYRGVYWSNTRLKWVSCIENNGKKYHLGCFPNPILAAKSYNNYVLNNKTFHPLNVIP
jgi:hypothetical protein